MSESKEVPLSCEPAASADAHELWAAAQLSPGEGIEDGVKRIETMLSPEPPSAELRRLCAERDDYRRRWSDAESNLAFCDSDLQTLEIELAALRKRIEDAPKGECRCTLGKCELRDVDAAALSLYGKRVALVVMEDE